MSPAQSATVPPGSPQRRRPAGVWRQMAANGNLETLVWVAAIVALWMASSDFAGAHDQYRWGAAAWPRAVLVLAAIAVLGQWFNRRQHRGDHASEREEEQQSAALATNAAAPTVSSARIAATFALPLVYTLSLSHVGFFVATPVFLGFYMAVFGARRWRHLVGTNLVFCLVVATVFSRLLYVPLPVGEWSFFYEASHFLIALLRAGS